MKLSPSQKEFADADRARLEAELSGPDLSELDQKILNSLEVWECSHAYNLNDTVRTVQGHAATANLPYSSIMNIGKMPPSTPGKYPWWTVWESPSQILEWNKVDLSEMPEMLHPAPPPMFSKRFKEFVLVGLIVTFVFLVLHYWTIK